MSAATDVARRGASAPSRLLVVDDHDGVRATCRMRFASEGWLVEDVADGEAALARLAAPGLPTFDAVLCDFRLPGASGLEVLEAALSVRPDAPVFMMSAHASVDVAVRVVRAGASDLLEKPFDFTDLLERIEAARAATRPHAASGEAGPPRAPRSGARRGVHPGASLVAHSASMRAAVELARRVASGRSTVLVTGETGTGKELVAALIHDSSDRAQGPFEKVNCAAVPETLLESELFGHERGAFTGADRRRVGRFEQANGGTLFLDEIGDMAPSTQAKLLRVLQDQEFFRLGGTRPLRTDARIIAATNQDLDLARAQGRFRQDLYFRLDVIGIELAPLRQRPDDLEPLLDRFVAEVCDEIGRPSFALEPDALEALRAHPWPGNVRELRNVVERAVLTARGERIERADLALDRRAIRTPGGPGNDSAAPGVSLDAMERRLVLSTLEQVGWVQKSAAQLLDVSPRKLNYMIQRMGITHTSWRRNRTEPDVKRTKED